MGSEVFGAMDSCFCGNDKRGLGTSEEAVGSGRHGPTHLPPIRVVMALSILPAHHG